jgi:hypothetical protein
VVHLIRINDGRERRDYETGIETTRSRIWTRPIPIEIKAVSPDRTPVMYFTAATVDSSMLRNPAREIKTIAQCSLMLTGGEYAFRPYHTANRMIETATSGKFSQIPRCRTLSMLRIFTVP